MSDGFRFSTGGFDPRKVYAPEGSTNAELLALPQQREHTHDMKGRLLYLPRTGMVVVPHGKSDHHGYYVTVVLGERGPRRPNGEEVYPRGGYDLAVSHLELQTAIELAPEFLYEVQIKTRQGREMNMSALSLENARDIAAMNERDGHSCKIVQLAQFIAADTSEAPPHRVVR